MRYSLEAEFRNLGEEAKSWRGFKGRVFPYEEISSDGINRETKFRYFYKKTFFKDGKIKIEAKSFKKTLKEKISTFNTVQDFIDSGFNIELLQKTEFKQEDQLKNKKLQKFIECFEDDFDFYDFDNDLEEWIENPGGIAGNVLSKLPKFLYIPANEGKRDLEENKGALQEVLSELFKDVREGSVNYVKAQKYLSNLAEEMDANDESTEFGKMMLELNQTMDSVFSGISMRAQTILTDAESSIKPSFKITMQSNIETPINQQGTGVIRSAVFALLRYKAQRDLKKQSSNRDLIICFEEPEIYLHPNAANQLRDTVYDLALTINNQIICTTHSPYMIDLSRKAGQVLNYLSLKSKSGVDLVTNISFNHEKAFRELQEDDKSYVKMLLKLDDYLARIFFAKNVLIIEGDTEEIVLRESVHAMPDDMRKNVKNNWQIIRARGKGAIISLVKYLKSMGISPFVIHDRDSTVPGAAIMNEPIRKALDNDERLFVVEECIEDILGYIPPSADKPFKAFEFIQENWRDANGNYDYNKISEKWREILNALFEI